MNNKPRTPPPSTATSTSSREARETTPAAHPVVRVCRIKVCGGRKILFGNSLVEIELNSIFRETKVNQGDRPVWNQSFQIPLSTTGVVVVSGNRDPGTERRLGNNNETESTKDEEEEEEESKRYDLFVRLKRKAERSQSQLMGAAKVSLRDLKLNELVDTWIPLEDVESEIHLTYIIEEIPAAAMQTSPSTSLNAGSLSLTRLTNSFRISLPNVNKLLAGGISGRDDPSRTSGGRRDNTSGAEEEEDGAEKSGVTLNDVLSSLDRIRDVIYAVGSAALSTATPHSNATLPGNNGTGNDYDGSSRKPAPTTTPSRLDALRDAKQELDAVRVLVDRVDGLDEEWKRKLHAVADEYEEDCTQAIVEATLDVRSGEGEARDAGRRRAPPLPSPEDRERVRVESRRMDHAAARRAIRVTSAETLPGPNTSRTSSSSGTRAPSWTLGTGGGTGSLPAIGEDPPTLQKRRSLRDPTSLDELYARGYHREITRRATMMLGDMPPPPLELGDAVSVRYRSYRFEVLTQKSEPLGECPGATWRLGAPPPDIPESLDAALRGLSVGTRVTMVTTGTDTRARRSEARLYDLEIIPAVASGADTSSNSNAQYVPRMSSLKRGAIV